MTAPPHQAVPKQHGKRRKRRSPDEQKQIAQRLVTLVDLLSSIDPTSPQAKQNTISISDDNGGRIQL
jgi:hypothetical protein